MTAHTLNHRLAELTGWSNIIKLGGAMLGTPPAGEPQCRGQALVPDWVGDWRDCGPLGSAHQIDTLHNWNLVAAKGVSEWTDSPTVYLSDAGRDDAMRRAIVLAVIAKLEAGQ